MDSVLRGLSANPTVEADGTGEGMNRQTMPLEIKVSRGFGSVAAVLPFWHGRPQRWAQAEASLLISLYIPMACARGGLVMCLGEFPPMVPSFYPDACRCCE